MAMINLKRSEKEIKKMEGGKEVSIMSHDKYPWGLEISLETEVLDKLGLSAADVTVKQPFNITAKALVESVSMNQNLGREKMNQSIRLQITDMELTPGKKPGNSLREVKLALGKE